MRRFSLLAVTTLVVAGCGSKDSSTTTTAATTPAASTTTTAPKPDEPKGKLSADEYKAIHAAYVRLAKLENVKSLKQAVRITDGGCRELTVQTALVQRFRSACVQGRRALAAIEALESQKTECTQALNAGDVSCYSNLFRVIGRAARVSMVRDRAVNAEIRRRGLGGACRRELESSEKDLGNADAMTHDAISAANAAERRDQAAFLRATQRLQQDLKSGDDHSARAGLRRLKTCA